MRFLRTIRLDESDVAALEPVAEPGEWAVTGSFVFLDDDLSSLSGKRLQCFRNGFLGTTSFGWSTLVEIAEMHEDELQAVIDRLAQHLVDHHGAPHIAAALPMAADEAEYTRDICEFETHTLLTLERELGEGGIVEQLKVVRPRKAFTHEGLKAFQIGAPNVANDS